MLAPNYADTRNVMTHANSISRIGAMLVWASMLLALASWPVASQDGASQDGTAVENAAQEQAAEQAPQADAAQGEAQLPSGFSSIQLGMSMQEVQRRLQQDDNFDYEGQPDVSLVPQGDQKLIETTGFTFVDRAFFQFYQDRLYIIILLLNRDEIDHYGMYTTLTQKYGKPRTFSPEATVWQNEEVRLSLERPLTVKYVDRQVFSQLKDQSQAEESIRTLSREQFLEQF
jgi:hypothetical protein